ncbi:TetR/AcrR family transcriptional regulator [Lacticaseibacillus daqingensis]|uniref:TetR/AcrR family transcriptional regulator n=1 Tax=Lacticaseibacillus daqingensis TaxID=2486014 RepID=UPI000F766217|nr:TetR/AcrR family transcriptional regulator [Lacticaseibacillus daqingensis]
MSVNDVTTLFDQTLAESDLSDKQKAVLRASLALFAKQGFARTSTSDIARAAGVSEGTVYKRFKTKDDILQAILRPFIAEVVPKAAGEFAASTMTHAPETFEAFLRLVLTDRITFALRNYQVVKIMVGEALQRPELVADVKIAFTQLMQQRLVPVVQHYQAAGQLVDWPATEIIAFTAGTIAGDIVPRLLAGQSVTAIDAMVDREVQFLLKGLAPE